MRVLIVDDSPEMRRLLREVLAGCSVEVVAEATDGDEALMQVIRHSPDLLLLDLEMPRMDGFTFLRLLMARRPTPVVVVSGRSERGNVFKALELGAIDFIAKPRPDDPTDLPRLRNELAMKVDLVRQLSPATHWGQRTRSALSVTGRIRQLVHDPTERLAATGRSFSRVVLVGASTGGPSALVEIMSQLRNGTSLAVVIAQHMPPKFTTAFAERLNRLGTLRVSEAQGVVPLRAGEALVCPGGQCVEIREGSTGPVLAVVPPNAGDRYRPSVDRLFRTAAAVLARRAVAVVLTGMGTDGAEGAPFIAARGGLVLCESADTAVVYGMPRAVVATGIAVETLRIEDVASRLLREGGAAFT